MSDVQDPVGGDDTLAPPAPLAGAASALDRPFTAAAEGVDADARDAVPDGPSADTTTIAALPGSSAGEPSDPSRVWKRQPRERARPASTANPADAR